MQSVSAVVTDNSGAIYLTGWAASYDFPVLNPPPNINQLNRGAFVTKMRSDGGGLIFSTFLGGGSAVDIALDRQGNTYVLGNASDNGGPPRVHSIPLPWPNQATVFVAKLSPAGSSLLYGTYLGGTDGEAGEALVVDPDGAAYVVGGNVFLRFPDRIPTTGE